ncbi:mannosyltransferase [Sparganum proliferum]
MRYAQVFGLPGWFKFFCIRLQLSLLYAFASCLLAHYCSKRLFPNEPTERASFGIIFCVLSFVSPGAFISMSSAVPSAYAASTTSLMLAFWINGDLFFAVGTVAFSALLLWPFSACLGIPLAIFFLLKDPKRFFAYTMLWAVIIIPLIVAVDSYYYGKCMQAKTRLLTNTVHDLPLADDFELNTTTEVDMQWSTDLLDAGCANFGRTITKDKPVIMRQSSPNTQDCTSARITVDDHKPKTVDSFAYLESAPSNSTKIDDEVSIWIS